MPASLTGSVRARREQFLAYNDERSVTLAKKFIAGKLVNQANFLKLMAKNRRQTDPRLSEKLYESGKLIDDANDRISREQGSNIDEKRQQIMNLEAEAARYYWNCVRQILPAELEFTGRITRGATDPFNAMLNFGYQTVLFPEIWKAVSYAGLDFYAGYCMPTVQGKPSLVLDMMEEFRQQLVDEHNRANNQERHKPMKSSPPTQLMRGGFEQRSYQVLLTSLRSVWIGGYV
jgi:CRISPR-associated protein Cas1